MKAAVPAILVRQEDGRRRLKFLAPPVFSLGMILFVEGARTKWESTVFFLQM